MDAVQKPTPDVALDRAFEIARSGACKNFEELKQRLKEEGFGETFDAGPYLQKLLASIVADRSPVRFR